MDLNKYTYTHTYVGSANMSLDLNSSDLEDSSAKPLLFQTFISRDGEVFEHITTTIAH